MHLLSKGRATYITPDRLPCVLFRWDKVVGTPRAYRTYGMSLALCKIPVPTVSYTVPGSPTWILDVPTIQTYMSVLNSYVGLALARGLQYLARARRPFRRR